MRAKFFLSRLKAQREKSGRRILLDDNMDGGTAMLRQIRIHCAGIWILAGPPLTYIQFTVCAISSKLHRTFQNLNIV